MADAFPLNWELDSLYPNPETDEFRVLVDGLRDSLRSLADEDWPVAGGTDESRSAWADLLELYSDVQYRLTSLTAFVECHAAADAGNHTFRRYEAELSALGPLMTAIRTNLEFALQTAGDEDFDAFLNGNAVLEEHAFFLATARRSAGFRLPRELELLAADLSVDGLHAWSRLYDAVAGDLRVPVMERGELVEKSPGQISLESPERSVRENCFFAANRAWAGIADLCAEALNHIAGSRLSKYRRLGIDPLEYPLHLNRMSRATLETMWATVQQRKPVLVRFLEKKAELLGIERLAWWDLQAPLTVSGRQSPAGLPYDQACRLTIDALAHFSPGFGEFAQMAIERRWVEVEDRPGKRQGGFCTDLPAHGESRIFMTYTGTVDGMATLAHEIGHAYHSHLLRDRPMLLRDYPMNLAETASTFAEAVLGERRLEQASSPVDELCLLDEMLSDAVAFLMNIHARFLFEEAFHRERAAGEVSVDRLNELMTQAQRTACMDALAADGWNPLFWASKLHFYIADWPFYNFPYTFGYLLSLGLFGMARGTADFPARFDGFLVATGCQQTETAVLECFGHDLTAETFWHLSLDVVEQRVSRFLELADSVLAGRGLVEGV